MVLDHFKSEREAVDYITNRSRGVFLLKLTLWQGNYSVMLCWGALGCFLLRQTTRQTIDGNKKDFIVRICLST